MDLVLIDYSKGTEGHRSASPDHFCKTYHFLQKMTQSTKTTETVENVVNCDMFTKYEEEVQVEEYYSELMYSISNIEPDESTGWQ